MIQRRCIRQWLVKLLLIIFAMLALRSFLEPHQMDLETEIKYNASDLKSNVLNEQLSYSETVMTSQGNPIINLKCGYDSCPTGKPGFLNVHLVPHSHDDLGFYHTMNQYYYGGDKIVGVVNIIDGIVEGLKDHPNRKFIFVEIAFFHKWWNAQNETTKNITKNLVNNGQLEFINGGWCMNDEAVTHHVDIIDQLSLGSRFLTETFGECGRPKVGWQIDTFGHSKEHASILAQMGFHGIFLMRIHEQERLERRESKSMEFVWNANNDLGIDGKIFTGVLYDHYEAPPFLCYDKNQWHESWVDSFLAFLKPHSVAFRTSDIMVPIGSDFRHRSDFTCFTHTDKLIENANKRQVNGSKVNLFYSTPSCYLKALNSHNNVTWPSYTNDMLPYLRYGYKLDESHHDQEYWTGFYTSRPAYKYMVRVGSNLLQSCKQMASYLSMKSTEFVGDISVLSHAMGVMQHHDAVTGSSNSFVTDDYIRMLYRGFVECFKIQQSFYQKELEKGKASPINFKNIFHCNLNMSQCDITENSKQFVVNIYNPLASFVNKYVRIPVLNQDYRVLDPSGKAVLVDVMPIPDFVKTLPGRNSSATHELVFLAYQLPPLGSKSYYIKSEKKSSSEMRNKAEEMFIQNERVFLRLNKTTGLIQSLSVDGEKLDLEQEILWYAAREPRMKNYTENLLRRPSGFYIFRPNQTAPFPMRKQEGVPVSIYKGKLVQEIHQTYNSWVGQVIRIYKGDDHVEMDWIVGPINIDDTVGKEVVNRITTKMLNDQEFYTDSNGRQIIKRRVGVHGDLLNTTINEPVAANYYPINSHISIKDKLANKQLTLLVDRAQGGSSLEDGLLELMVHRRLLYDDAYHGEVLNETAYGVGLAVRGTHLLLLSSILESVKLTRSLGIQMYKQPQVSFIPTTLSFKEWSKKYKMEVRILNKDLPWNVDILTLEKRQDNKYLLRLAHTFGKGEDQNLSKPVMINLKKLFFNGYDIATAEETTLDGNQLKKDSQRFFWKESSTTQQNDLSGTRNVVDITKIKLNPMEIRTFILTVEKKSVTFFKKTD